MDWLSKHNGLTDCAKKAVRVTPSSGKELEYVAENLVMDKAASNRIMLNHLDVVSTLDIRTASEYLNVFSEELPGMPPDREIEFVIELVPGTTSIFKRPYRTVAVTPTFYKNKILCKSECISNYSAYEKSSKNKSCIGCITWHGISYFSKILEGPRRI
jgi:hypothetical protein